MSPKKAIFFPFKSSIQESLCGSLHLSRRVKISVKVWHGCNKSVRALMTGILLCLANSSMISCSKVLIMSPCIYLDNTLAVSLMLSPLPTCIVLSSKYKLVPPNSLTPISNETRVLVLFLKKSNPHVCLSKTGGVWRFLNLLKSAANEKTSFIS